MLWVTAEVHLAAADHGARRAQQEDRRRAGRRRARQQEPRRGAEADRASSSADARAQAHARRPPTPRSRPRRSSTRPARKRKPSAIAHRSLRPKTEAEQAMQRAKEHAARPGRGAGGRRRGADPQARSQRAGARRSAEPAQERSCRRPWPNCPPLRARTRRRCSSSPGDGTLAAWLGLADELAALMRASAGRGRWSPIRSSTQRRSSTLLSGLMKPPAAGQGQRNFVQHADRERSPRRAAGGRAPVRELKNAAEGVADCLIESAFPLDRRAGRPNSSPTLRASFGCKLKPEVASTRPDRRRARPVGDQVLDTSVASRLGRCRRQLAAALKRH